MNENIHQIGYMISSDNYSDLYRNSLTYGNRLDKFAYDWEIPEQHDIVVFGDSDILKALDVRFSNVKYKVAWLMESPALFSENVYHANILKWLIENIEQFAVIVSTDETFVENYNNIYPNKFKHISFGGSQILKHETKIYDKTELCSMTSGVMRWQGHKMRIKIFEELEHSGINFMGRGFNAPFNPHIIGFRDYMYHITISNCRVGGYFGSHLLDPIACGTVPIYCGCPNIDKFFNMDGIISFDTVDELKDIMETIGDDDYRSRLPAMKENMKLLEEYRTPENMLWKNVLKGLYDNLPNNN